MMTAKPFVVKSKDGEIYRKGMESMGSEQVSDQITENGKLYRFRKSWFWSFLNRHFDLKNFQQLKSTYYRNL